jgi:uncharacterized repeat protein (TIGR02543 family)
MSNPKGINCGKKCFSSFNSGTTVSLTATSSPDSTFIGWSGNCLTYLSVCNIGINSAKNVKAIFNKGSYHLVRTSSIGPGKVESSPGGIDCGSDCWEYYSSGSFIKLIATPNDGETFYGWTGDCSGSNPICNINVNSAKNANAEFVPPIPVGTSKNLNVFITGSGSVTSNLNGINCPGDCGEAFITGTSVRLTANPSNGFSFYGWTGACSGSSNICDIVMDVDKNVKAVFV